MSTAFAVLGFAVALVLCLGGGIVIGLCLYHELAKKFQRDADSAWQKAHDKAFQHWTDHYNERRAKADMHENGPFPKNGAEMMADFEQGLRNVGYTDKEIGIKLEEKRREAAR